MNNTGHGSDNFNSARIGIRYDESDWVDDRVRWEYSDDGGTTWYDLEYWPTTSPADSLTTRWFDATEIGSWTEVDACLVRLRGSGKESSKDGITVYVDAIELEVTYNHAPVITTKTYNSSLIEKTIFAIGENITIRANVTDADGASDITGVNITIINPNSMVMVNNASMDNISVIANGSTYEYNYTDMPVDSTSVGTWNVIIYANDTAGQTPSSTTFSAYRNYLTVDTNATNLYVNDTVLISGTVTNLSDNTAVSGATVNISITYPDSSQASFAQKTTNSQGAYNTTYTVSPTDPLGVYTVNVNTSDGLGNITTNSTTFEVIINPNIRVVTNR